jgi:LIVCS family branched-chain amino acid:cation transporter
VALACFTTAVGIVTGTADFFKGLLGDSQTVYQVTAVIGCLLGVGMGQLDVHNIIAVAFPALMFIYPITIVLILLNVIPDKFATPKVFKAVVIVTIIFSIPDFLATLGPKIANQIEPVQGLIPLGANRLGWLVPALITFVLVNTLQQIGKKT